jgi:hypothetical protein
MGHVYQVPMGWVTEGQEFESQWEKDFPLLHVIKTLLSRRGATEHSSTRPRFSTHNLLIVFE